MSVEISPTNTPRRETARPIEEIASGFEIDPRISEIVPGFDAPFFQAGLAGYSDAPMRLIARRHGAPFAVTEALLDQTLINGGKGRQREDPDLLAEELGMGDPGKNAPAGDLNDHPIAGQIIGTEPDEMAHGSAILVEMGYDLVDVNFACPVRKVRRRNRGGHLLTSPDEAVSILQAVRETVPDNVPTTVKLRRGWDDTPQAATDFDRIFNAAYESGYAWTTVHCRSVQQKYAGPSRWRFLAGLTRRYPDRLIFGSGDIWSARDIFAMLELTGVNAVSVARGCIGNPWIFRQARDLLARRRPAPPTLSEQRRALMEHFELSVTLWGERAASRMMRKFGIKFADHHPQPDAVKADFIKCKSVADWRAVLDRRYSEE